MPTASSQNVASTVDPPLVTPPSSAASAVATAPPVAVQAVEVASASAASSSALSQAQPATEIPVPGKRRRTGKSKLSQAWGPNDLEEDGSPSASASGLAEALNKSYEPASVILPEEPQTVSARDRQSRKGKWCPSCEKNESHPLPQCPIVLAGPKSIQKRLTTLKMTSGDPELIKELSQVLEQIEERRRSSNTNPKLSEPSSNRSAKAIPIPSPVRRSTLSHRSVSSPRLPAGSEISEVAVESRDEGSSNESSSSDDEDEPVPPTQSSTIIPDPTALEALLWGPPKPRESVLSQILSSSESESGDSEDEEVQKEEEVDLDEEVKNDKAFRRMSRKFERAVSSSDEELQPEVEQEPDGIDADEAEETKRSESVPVVMEVDPNDSIDTAVRPIYYANW